MTRKEANDFICSQGLSMHPIDVSDIRFKGTRVIELVMAANCLTIANNPTLTLSATTYLHPSGALVIEYPGNPLLTIILGDRKATTLIEGLESVIAAMQLAEIVPDDIPTLGADGVLRDSKGNPIND
jgi:hypothetical protein